MRRLTRWRTGAPFESHGAVFRHHVVDIGAVQRDRRAKRQGGSDLRNHFADAVRLFHRRRGAERDKGFALPSDICEPIAVSAWPPVPLNTNNRFQQTCR